MQSQVDGQHGRESNDKTIDWEYGATTGLCVSESGCHLNNKESEGDRNTHGRPALRGMANHGCGAFRGEHVQSRASKRPLAAKEIDKQSRCR